MAKDGDRHAWITLSTLAMDRGAADANGRFEVAIWEAPEPAPGAAP